MASAGSSTKSSASSPRRRDHVVCIANEGYAASLERRKLYTVLRDDEAAARGLLRIIDESGEDYLYPKKFFAAVALSPRVARELERV